MTRPLSSNYSSPRTPPAVSCCGSSFNQFGIINVTVLAAGQSSLSSGSTEWFRGIGLVGGGARAARAPRYARAKPFELTTERGRRAVGQNDDRGLTDTLSSVLESS
jgi:hypothetical protein